MTWLVTRSFIKAVKATYENGQITLTEKPAGPGPVEVLVVFPEFENDPWERILAVTEPRASFAAFADKCSKEIAEGKAKALSVDDL